MNIREYVEKVKKDEPLLENINDGKAVMFLRAVFQQIAQEIKDTKEGQVKIPGLGQFHIKEVEREKDGQKDIVKRVGFRPLQKKDDADKV